MQSCCFGFEQHLGRWAVFSAAFHHTERAPRVTSSLTAKSPTIRSFKTSLVSIQGFSPPVSCARGRLVNENKASLNVEDQHKRTALHYAAWASSKAVVERLLQHDADKRGFFPLDIRGQSALHLGAERAEK